MLYVAPPGNPASLWSGDFWSNRISLILANKNSIFLYFSDNFFVGFFNGFGVSENQPSVHSGGVSRGGSLAVAVGVSDR